MSSYSTKKNIDEVYCTSCRSIIKLEASICLYCGVPNRALRYHLNSRDNRLILILLCLFLGCFGIHRLYVGRICTGLMYMFTLGLFGVGVIYDLISIARGTFDLEL